MGLPLKSVRYLANAPAGRVPSLSEIESNAPVARYPIRTFELRRTFRNRLVAFAFDRHWAVWILWNSWVGSLIHRLFYALAGRPFPYYPEGETDPAVER